MKKKITYLIIFITALCLSITLSTYAYWLVSSNSPNSSIKTSSTNPTISMIVSPLYSGFKFIPMDDTDTLTALKNACKDNKNRGACLAYKINVKDYPENTKTISGYMDVQLNNIKHLSYMVLEETEEYTEANCIEITTKTYCIAKPATPVNDGVKLSLGDSYKVNDIKEKNLILVIWLTNLNKVQNQDDLGTFQSSITFSLEDGTKIKGSIAASITQDDGTGGEKG